MRLLATVLLVAAIAPAPQLGGAPSDLLDGGYYTIATWPADARVFAAPSGAAVDSAGNVYVADTRNHVIKKLSPSGEVLAVWGGKGSGDGEFNEPAAVAVGASGDIYVADTQNNRVQVLGSDGTFVRKWGSAGAADGDLAAPAGIALDGSENVYVSDTGNGRIQKFTPTGSFTASWGSTGPGNGQFDGNRGVAVGPDGSVYVADVNNRRIQKFTSAGTYVTQWGPEPDGTGGYTSRYIAAYGVYATSAGVFVADSGRHVIERCSTSGAVIATWGSEGSGDGQFLGPEDVTVDTTGTVYVADTRNNRIAILDSSGVWQGSWSSGGSGEGELAGAEDVSVDATGSVYVADTDNNRIQRLSSDGVFEVAMGSLGSGAGQLNTPGGVAVSDAGTVYVADTGNSRIQTYDTSGTPLGSFGTSAGSGQLAGPSGVNVAPDGTVWVADSGNDRINHYSAAGSYLGGFGVSGGDAGQLSDPRDVAVDTTGTVYVCDTGNNRVQRFTSAGVYLGSWGSWGTAEGKFQVPTKLALGSDGDVYVADAGNNRVQRFTPDGSFRIALGSTGSEVGQMRWPAGVGLDATDRVLVAERDNHRVQVFGYDGAAPVTTAYGVPVGWSSQPVTVTLVATDDASGVEATYYRLGAGADTTYTAPFTVIAQGETMLRFWSVDRMGQVEAENIERIKIDSLPPSGTFVLDGGAAHATTTAVTANNAMTDAVDMRFDTGSGYGAWENYATSRALALSGEGTHTVNAQFRDWLGNTATKSDTIQVDHTPPTSAASGVSDDWVVGPVDVSLEASDNLSGVAVTYYSVDGASAATYTAPIEIAEEGEFVVGFHSVDRAGNIEATRTVTVKIDSIPPSGTMQVDGGAQYANSRTLTVDSAVTGAIEMRLDVGGGYGSWVPYAAAATATAPGDGETTVTAQYRDDASNILELSDTIVVDTVAPIVDRTWRRGDSLETMGSAVTVGFSATDLNGATAFSWVVDADSETVPDTVAESTGSDTGQVTATIGNGALYVHIRARDAAGNWGDAVHVAFTFRSGRMLGRPIVPAAAMWRQVFVVTGGIAGDAALPVVVESSGFVDGEWVAGPSFDTVSVSVANGWTYKALVTLPRGMWTLRARAADSTERSAYGGASQPIRIR